MKVKKVSSGEGFFWDKLQHNIWGNFNFFFEKTSELYYMIDSCKKTIFVIVFESRLMKPDRYDFSETQDVLPGTRIRQVFPTQN